MSYLFFFFDSESGVTITPLTATATMNCQAHTAKKSLCTMSATASMTCQATVIYTLPDITQPEPDFQNTLTGAIYIPNSGPRAIALTFIRGKYIYSEVKRKNPNIKIEMVEGGFVTKKPSIQIINYKHTKHKAKHGKATIEQKQVRSVQVPVQHRRSKSKRNSDKTLSGV